MSFIKGSSQPFINDVFSPENNNSANVSAFSACVAGGDTIFILGGGYYNPSYQETNFSTYTFSDGISEHLIIGQTNHSNVASTELIVKNSCVYFLMTVKGIDGVVKAHFIKMSKSGQIIWEKIFTQNTYLSIFQLKEDADGGFLLVGSFDNGMVINDISMDLCLIRTDSIGNEIERRTQGLNASNKSLLGRSVYVTSSGEYIVGAMSIVHTAQFSDPSCGGNFVKFNSDGTTQTLLLGRSLYSEWYPDKMLGCADGNILVPTVKQHDNFPSTEYTMLNYTAPALMKIDENLNIIWRRVIDTTYASFYSIKKGIATNDGNYVFLGDYSESLQQYSLGRTVLIKTNGEANVLWNRKYYYIEENSRNIIHDIQLLPDGGFFMCGETMDQFGITQYHQQRMWFLRTDAYGCLVPGCQYADMEGWESGSHSVKVYPNPASEYIYVLNPSQSNDLTASILDITGKMIKQGVSLPANTTAIIPLKEWPAGVYYLTTYLGQKVVSTEKIIKN